MTRNELLERRAERGTPRGASAVWRDANLSLDNASSSLQFNGRKGESHTTWFRLAIGVAALVSAFVAFVPVITNSSSSTTEATRDALPAGADQPEVGPNESEPTGELPDSAGPPPILMDRNAGGSESFELAKIRTRGPSEEGFAPGAQLATPIRVFAHPSDPFDHSIVVVGLGDEGDQRVVLNWDEATLASVTEGVVNEDGQWKVDPSLDLVEVANFETEVGDPAISGWELVYEEINGANFERLQREAELTIVPGDIERLWLNLADAARNSDWTNDADPATERRSAQVAGQQVIFADSRALWLDGGDVFELRVYDYDTQGLRQSVDPEKSLAFLRVASQSEWESQLDESDKTSSLFLRIVERLPVFFLILGIVGLGIYGIYRIVRSGRRWLMLAAVVWIVLMSLAWGWAMTSSPSAVDGIHAIELTGSNYVHGSKLDCGWTISEGRTTCRLDVGDNWLWVDVATEPHERGGVDRCIATYAGEPVGCIDHHVTSSYWPQGVKIEDKSLLAAARADSTVLGGARTFLLGRSEAWIAWAVFVVATVVSLVSVLVGAVMRRRAVPGWWSTLGYSAATFVPLWFAAMFILFFFSLSLGYVD